MGTITDIVDLAKQLSNSVQDRKIATELNAIQSLTLELQVEQEALHKSNVELREQRLSLKKQIQELESKIQELSSASSTVPDGIPLCPNCSTSSKPYYMSPLGEIFISTFNITHECPKCKYSVNVK